MQDQRVLVAGGAGFIGSVLANHLAADNDVIALDDCSLGTPANLDESVSFIEASVLEDDLADRVGDIDVAFHFAARSSRTMHEGDPADGARVNVEGFVNTVDSVRETADAIVYASTSSVYGTHTEPAMEDDPVTARTEYEASKLARERYAESFSARDDLPIAGLRLFSVYQGLHANEGHKNTYANTISQFADTLAVGDPPRIYGDGSQTRDFVHVEDVVRACERVAEERCSGIYNVGTGRATSFTEMIEALRVELGADVEPEYVPCPLDNYVEHTIADATKLEAATGWTPEISFEEGIERVCAPYDNRVPPNPSRATERR